MWGLENVPGKFLNDIALLAVDAWLAGGHHRLQGIHPAAFDYPY